MDEENWQKTIDLGNVYTGTISSLKSEKLYEVYVTAIVDGNPSV